MRTTTIALLLTAAALFTSACTADVESEPTATVSQKITACGFQEYDTAVCDRGEVLGTCTEFRTEGMDLADAREVCESSDGIFRQQARCPRTETLLGACPSEEKAGELRLHYYYVGDIFQDESVPTMACSALSNDGWCSAK
ncbi:MAG: hypothetical protein ACOC1F_13780 [Myxococcota bacterium]